MTRRLLDTHVFLFTVLACAETLPGPNAGSETDLGELPDVPAALEDARPLDVGATSDSDTATPPPATFESKVLFESGDDGYAIYRIPALVTTASGVVLAFAEGRQSLYDDGDIDIVLRRSLDGGETFEPLRVIIDIGGDTAGNPSPIPTASGRVWLPYTTNPGDDDTIRTPWLTWSDDEGLTWAPPRDLGAAVVSPGATWYATGPGRGIATSSGRLVVPCNEQDASGVRRSHVIYSDDDGETWVRGGAAAPGTDEAQVAELSDGRLLLNMRYEGDRRARAIAISADGGDTWSDTTFDDALPDPACQGSLLATPNGLFFSNPATVETFPRDHVTVRHSLDDGATWAWSRVVDAGPSAYSALTALPDGRLAMLWESGDLLPYDRLRIARFDVAWIGAAE